VLGFRHCNASSLKIVAIVPGVKTWPSWNSEIAEQVLGASSIRISFGQTVVLEVEVHAQNHFEFGVTLVSSRSYGFMLVCSRSYGVTLVSRRSLESRWSAVEAVESRWLAGEAVESRWSAVDAIESRWSA
jgi:hypothetical protein